MHPHKKQKKFSELLIEAERRTGLTPGEMAFILGIKEQMYQMYRRGKWDKTKNSSRRDGMVIMLSNLKSRIEARINILQSAIKRHDFFTPTK